MRSGPPRSPLRLLRRVSRCCLGRVRRCAWFALEKVVIEVLVGQALVVSVLRWSGDAAHVEVIVERAVYVIRGHPVRGEYIPALETAFFVLLRAELGCSGRIHARIVAKRD